MKKMKKFLRFEDIELIATEQHPKDISRAFLKVIDFANNNQSYKTFHYGIVQPTSISWNSAIQMPFIAQESLRFQTICQHEYGYEIQELKALYNGIIYLKPDQFFFQNTTHCLNKDGKQCGVLKYMIKVIQREENKKKDQQIFQTKEPVKVNLVAKISIYAATLVMGSFQLTMFQKKKKHNLKLSIIYDKQTYLGQPKFGQLQYKWLINSKFQVNDNSPDSISIKIEDDDHPFLHGILHMATLQANKRFTVQIVPLIDQNNQSIAALHLDLRYISKRQLLDLMYSPKQLSDTKQQNKNQQKHFQMKDRSSSLVSVPKQEKKLYDLLHKRAFSKQLTINKSRVSLSHRYHANLFNDKHEPSIPRSKRFADLKDINDHISYVDPSLISDFSPRTNMRKGATQSSTNKTDFTKHLKANPGVGQYHLPSIWQKK